LTRQRGVGYSFLCDLKQPDINGTDEKTFPNRLILLETLQIFLYRVFILVDEVK